MIGRRDFLLGVAAALSTTACGKPAKAVEIRVYKSASCRCCSAWVDRLRAAGFAVRVENVADVNPLARRLGVPDVFRACHSAEVGSYFIEGHVPPADIRKLLKEQPEAAGLAVPGMPIGSPGMEQGGRHEPYSTLLIDREGRARLFVDHLV